MTDEEDVTESKEGFNIPLRDNDIDIPNTVGRSDIPSESVEKNYG